MEPSIQYCKTSDGVSIAYYSMGDGQGPAVIWIELPSQLQLEQKLFPGQVRAYNAMARVGSLVRYDHRGFGLSDRNVTEFPLEDMVKDLEAVVDQLRLETVVLVAPGGFTGLVAIAYAAWHPERVAKLAMGAITHVSPALHQQYQALMGSSSNFRFVSESISRLTLGWDDEETSRSLAAWFRESGTYETFKAFCRDIGQWDVRNLLPAVEAETLIVAPGYLLTSAAPEGQLTSMEQAREMASVMPRTQMVIAEGETYEERTRSYQAAAASFIYGPIVTRPPMDVRTGPAGTAIILFADIANSTALTEDLGDAAFRDKARELDEALRRAIASNGGTAIDGKLLGDGVLATFGAAREAIACASAMHEAGSSTELLLHVGIHAGDVIREGDNVYGGAVNIAARVASEAAAGETLVSATVRELARTSAGVSFEDQGERELKGVSEPVRVFAVRAALRGEG